jgi:peptidoglycan-N-acetylglucosamine deacetylase
MLWRRVVDESTGFLLTLRFWQVWVLARLPLFQLRHVLFYVKTKEPVVALTLDDGPDRAITRRVLKTLKNHDAKATFFLLGEAAQRNRRTVEAIAAAGHELGNHTWRDESSARLPKAIFRRKLAKTHRVLARHGSELRLFRPGGGRTGWRGHVVKIAKAQHGYRTVLGSVYPHDVRIRSDRVVVKSVLRVVREGAIIVLHEGTGKKDQPPRKRIVRILDEVLTELARRGYSVVTVSELLAHADRHRARRNRRRRLGVLPYVGSTTDSGRTRCAISRRSR